jgi:hypothetical protein
MKIGERRLKKNMFNFKKVASILASAVMLSSTIGFAAAASYPTPFVEGGNADSAIIWGENAAMSDLTAAIDLQSDLSSLVKFGGTETEAAVSGEAAALFSGGTKLYINDSLNTVKSVLTKTHLPTILADGSFSGNVDTSMTQKINIGFNPSVKYKKQPTSSDDPNYALELSTTQANYLYNATVTLNKAVNFSHADSEGEEISIFGTTYTIGAATDTDTLVLLKSAEKLNLNSNTNPSEEVVIEGSTYNVELITTDDSSTVNTATIKVTDSTGDSETKKINEAASKKIQGITIAVTTADETNLVLTATVIAGSDKVTLEDGSSVTTGDDDTIVDGTLVDFESGNPNNLTKLTISVYAPESDLDAITSGGSFIDPVYGTFKVDFSGFNIETDDVDSREDITFQVNGDDKIEISFADHRGNQKTVNFAKNTTGAGLILAGDDNDKNISVIEKDKIQYEEFVMVGNEQKGYLLKLTAVKNSSQSGTAGDKVEFKDVFSGEVSKTTWTSDGVGTIEIGGDPYTVALQGPSSFANVDYNVSLNYPDSSGENAVIFPTIETSEGAKIAFYQPTTVNLSDWDGAGTDTAGFRFPDGDGYTNVATTTVGPAHNWSVGGTVINLTTAIGTTATIGQLTYVINGTTGTANGNTNVKISLRSVNGDEIKNPAVIIFQEQDDNNNYEAIIVELESGGTSDDGLGIDTIEDTWSSASGSWSSTRYSDSKKNDRGNLWGSLITVDSADSDQKTGTISYPDEQVYAQIYAAGESATITPGVTTGGGGVKY